MNDKIRSFIALELSEEIKTELSRIEDILKKAGADARWVKPGSIHLTLKFLGYITEDKIAPITKRIQKVASNFAPYDVTLGGIGVFPKWDRPRVLWVGISEGSDTTKDITLQVEEEMAEELFEKEERAFRAHLTIGRVRSPKNKKKLEDAARSVRVNPASAHITKIVLFKSDLSPAGSVYTPLAEAVLGKSG